MGDPMLRVLLWLWVGACVAHVLLSAMVTGDPAEMSLWWAIGLSAGLVLTKPSRETSR